MPAKSKLQLQSDDIARLPVLWDIVSRRVKKMGIQMKIAEPDKAEIEAWMAKKSKPYQLFYNLEKNVFSVDIRVDKNVAVLGKRDLASEPDRATRYAILKELQLLELVALAEIEAFEREHPDPAELDRARSQKRDLEYELQGDVADRKTIAAFTAYDKGGRAGGWDMTAHLKSWIKEHRPSWTHYIEFVEDVDAGKDGKAIFDRYAKENAEYPINLPPAIQGPIEKAVASGRQPDFKAARGLIVRVIDQKFIPPFRKDRLALYEKSMKDIALKLRALNKQLVGK